ncbi:hypothetical protein [Streptomyces lasiicapitis]|uniref:hypothetical protein n=1 Tax=Streptomyces lasiicapitis TaxID=1923961 RepID=UPI003666E6F3
MANPPVRRLRFCPIRPAGRGRDDPQPLGTIDELAALARTRRKRRRRQYQPGLLDGFIAETGLAPAPP